MARIDAKFKDLKRERKGVVPFITAGDPSLETTGQIILELERSGSTSSSWRSVL